MSGATNISDFEKEKLMGLSKLEIPVDLLLQKKFVKCL